MFCAGLHLCVGGGDTSMQRQWHQVEVMVLRAAANGIAVVGVCAAGSHGSCAWGKELSALKWQAGEFPCKLISSYHYVPNFDNYLTPQSICIFILPCLKAKFQLFSYCCSAKPLSTQQLPSKCLCLMNFGARRISIALQHKLGIFEKGTSQTVISYWHN